MGAAIHIDGSRGEGGGQILRTSLALAALLQQPVRVDNIRIKRSQPGLKTQHLAGVLALAAITAAEVKGAEKNATSLEFIPHTIKGGRYRFEIATAGAATMLLGAVLPVLLFAEQPSEITITGGTHVPFSPPFHYLEKVFLPALRKLGCRADIELRRWGFYPRGGGEIRAHVWPCHGLRGAWLDRRGALKSLRFQAFSANLPDHIARREIVRAETSLAEYAEKFTARSSACRALGQGNFVFLEAYYDQAAAGFSVLGRRGKPAEEVAEEACQAFRQFEESGATVDRYLADQIILYMALARGDSFFIAEKFTGHLATNIEIIRSFLPVEIEQDGATKVVTVRGAGLQARG